MEGPKRNPDRLNTIGIVTVGGVGAALVYLSIVGLQAFYVNDTSKVDEVASFGTQEETRKTLRAEQIGNITDPRAKGLGGPNNTPIYSIPIADAKKLVVRDAKVDAGNLIPALRRSDESTVQPVFGRPKPLTGAGAATPGTPGAAPGTEGATPPPAGGALPTLPQSPTNPGGAPDGLAPATPAVTPAGAVPAAGAAATTPAPPVTNAQGATTPTPPTPAPPPAPPPAPAPAHGGQH